MDKLIIPFPSSGPLETPLTAFSEEYETASTQDIFETRLFNFNRAIVSGNLNLSKDIPNKRRPAIFRGPHLSSSEYEQLLKAAKDAGITPITDAGVIQTCTDSTSIITIHAEKAIEIRLKPESLMQVQAIRHMEI